MRMVTDIDERRNQDIIFNYDFIYGTDMTVGFNSYIIPNYYFGGIFYPPQLLKVLNFKRSPAQKLLPTDMFSRP